MRYVNAIQIVILQTGSLAKHANHFFVEIWYSLLFVQFQLTCQSRIMKRAIFQLYLVGWRLWYWGQQKKYLCNLSYKQSFNPRSINFCSTFLKTWPHYLRIRARIIHVFCMPHTSTFIFCSRTYATFTDIVLILGNRSLICLLGNRPAGLHRENSKGLLSKSIIIMFFCSEVELVLQVHKTHRNCGEWYKDKHTPFRS